MEATPRLIPHQPTARPIGWLTSLHTRRRRCRSRSASSTKSPARFNCLTISSTVTRGGPPIPRSPGACCRPTRSSVTYSSPTPLIPIARQVGDPQLLSPRPRPRRSPKKASLCSCQGSYRRQATPFAVAFRSRGAGRSKGRSGHSSIHCVQPFRWLLRRQATGAMGRFAGSCVSLLPDREAHGG